MPCQQLLIGLPRAKPALRQTFPARPACLLYFPRLFMKAVSATLIYINTGGLGVGLPPRAAEYKQHSAALTLIV